MNNIKRVTKWNPETQSGTYDHNIHWGECITPSASDIAYEIEIEQKAMLSHYGTTDTTKFVYEREIMDSFKKGYIMAKQEDEKTAIEFVDWVAKHYMSNGRIGQWNNVEYNGINYNERCSNGYKILVDTTEELFEEFKNRNNG